MARQSPPPDLPADLLDRFGPPEEAFGPNLRFRTLSTLLGGFLIVLGFAGFVNGAALAAARDKSATIYMFLGGCLMAVGSAAVILPRRAPRTWIFVCARGLVRARGEDWESVEWDQVVRFDDVSMSSGVVAIRQCRVLLTDGTEWGFLADYVADFRRLMEMLRAKVGDGRA
ncbi:MAG TPA: hypothetical protein VHR66_22955 [Gemmataceae bacterium]|jgi:hypothetical protein|nr:hypothetical protein [Gemmataceae bacterium]